MAERNLSLAEVETHLNLVADNRNTWHVYTDDPVMQGKFEKIGAVLIKEDKHGPGRHYTLRANQVSFRRGIKPTRTEAQVLQAQKLAASRRNTE